MRHTAFPITIIVALLSLAAFSYGAFFLSSPKPPLAPLTARAKHAIHGGRARAVSVNIPPALSADRAAPDLSLKLMRTGGIGLILSVFLALGLARSVLGTQFATAQSFLKDERKAWEKKQSVYDAQRDQLIAELQVAQTKKDEMDTLRQHASRQFQEFFQTLPVACFCFAPNGKIIRWNAACEQLYGISSATMLSSTLWEKVVSPQEREATEGCVRRVLAGESLVDMLRQDRHADGLCCVKSSMVPMHDSDGTIIGILSASIGAEAVHVLEPLVSEVPEPPVFEVPENLEAITALEDTWAAIENARCALAKQQAENERLLPSLRDSVTGAWGHRAFHEHLQAEMERAARYHHPLTLVVVDLDDFGSLNQAQGYEAGDTALRSVAALINSKMRTVDVIARLSGDEFAVILPETGQAGARMAAERILAGIAGIGLDDQSLTACLGVSVLSPETLNTEMFLQQGLAALREAKSRGADCIAQYGEENIIFAR